MNDSLSKRLTQALGTSLTFEGEIGRGGMGVVYHARDERLKRKVAVKVLPPDLAFREEIRLRFLREAETAARLSHPHIVPIHSVREGPDGLVYFVMAYIDGEPLGSRLKRRGQLSPEEARRILMETADALGAAHALGIIHRDVKPDNILLEGSRGRVVVTDFGIAKALSSTTGPGTLTATGVAIGTPHYMSPEQAAGDREIDGRSDIYSLGVVGFEMLAGELPFLAPTVPGILLKQITEGAPPLMRKRPDCPEDLAACVMRSLEKEPEARWPPADALRRALESRATPAYQPRRPSTAFAPSRAFEGRAPARDLPARRSPFEGGPPARRPRRDAAQRGGAPKTNEPKIVQDARSSFVRWASVCGPLLVLNVATGNHIPSWSLMVGGLWMAFGLVPKYVRLWHAGYSWRDVLSRPPAPDATGARPPGVAARAAAPGVDRSGVAPRASGRAAAVVRDRNAERALRPAAAQVGRRGRRPGRSDTRHATRAGALTRRGQRDRGRRRDPRSPGRGAFALVPGSPPAARHELRSVGAGDSELQQRQKLVGGRVAAACPDACDAVQLVEAGVAPTARHRRREQTLRQRGRRVHRDRVECLREQVAGVRMPQGRLRRGQPRADLPGRGVPTTRADREHREPGVDLRAVRAARERAPAPGAP